MEKVLLITPTYNEAENIQKFINEKRVLYDYQADQKLDKWKSEVKLQKVELKDLPSYINKNLDKFKDWID